MKYPLTILLVLASLLSPAAAQEPSPWTQMRPPAPQELYRETAARRPLALAVAEPWLYVANRCGTVSVIDIDKRKVQQEVYVGRQLVDVVRVGDSSSLLLADQGQHRLILLRRGYKGLRIDGSWPVPKFPTTIQLSASGARGSVASLWARQVTLFDFKQVDNVDRLEIVRTIDLPFAPRNQWLSPDEKHLVVADAFGGRLAVIDWRRGEIKALRHLRGHHIRGLATSHDGEHLLVSHQLLNGTVATTRERVFWGNVQGNVLRSVPFAELWGKPDLSTAQSSAIGHWFLLPLGQPGHGTGDPGDLAVTSSGQAIVCLSGVDEVALRSAPLRPMTRYKVGRRPAAVAVSEEELVAFVANTFDDSISVLGLGLKNEVALIELGSMPSPTLVDRGESLFHDAHLSLDGWYSCQSCHVDGHTNGLLNDNFSDGTTGAPKRVLSLLGVDRTGPWAWDGQATSLSGQIHKSITSTMRGVDGADSDDNVRALEAYVRQLAAPPSLLEARGQVDPEAITAGHQVFQKHGCADCHAPPIYTTPDSYDVGLEDANGVTEFNPPSLRGVSQRGPYFHDNRAATLAEVFSEHNHAGAPLEPAELKSLLLFLQSL